MAKIDMFDGKDDFSLDPDTSIWKFVKIAFFEENEQEKLKEYILNRLDIITTLWLHSERDISLRIEDYKTLPSDIREKVVSLTMQLVEEHKIPERKIKTWHALEIKGFDMYLQMEVRDYIARHPKELMDEGLKASFDELYSQMDISATKQ